MYYCQFATPRYIPECLVGKTEITVEEVKNLNKLNEELACVLSQRNQAFTSFQHGNFTCIQLTKVRYSSMNRIILFIPFGSLKEPLYFFQF